jgi:hypothetical protein
MKGTQTIIMAAITFNWANPEKSILLCTYPGPGWTWSDMEKTLEEQHRLVGEVKNPVYIIVDVRNSNWMPPGGSFLSMAKFLRRQRQPNQRDTVIVGARGFVASIVTSLMRLTKEYFRDFHLVPSMEEAYALIGRLEQYRDKQPA